MGNKLIKVSPTRFSNRLGFASSSSVETFHTVSTLSNEDTEGIENLKIDEITMSSFRIGWDPPDNFYPVCYRVCLFSAHKRKSKMLIRALPEEKHTFERLHSCTEYTVVVTAVDAGGHDSASTTVTVFTLPSPPLDMQFPSNIQSNSLLVSWKRCKGKAGSYDVHIFEQEEHKPIAHVTDLKETNKLFKGLVPGTVYFVTVNNVVDGQSSEVISGTFMTAPRHVCDVIFTDITQHEMTCSWKKPEGNVDSYTLALSESCNQSGSSIVIENLQQTSYTFKKLTPGRLYQCKVVCKFKYKSSKQEIFTQCTVPTEVCDVTVHEAGQTEVVVTWTPGPGDADHYDLFLTPKQGVVGETSPREVTRTRYKFTGLVPATAYTVAIVTISKDKASKRVVSSFVSGNKSLFGRNISTGLSKTTSSSKACLVGDERCKHTEENSAQCSKTENKTTTGCIVSKNNEVNSELSKSFYISDIASAKPNPEIFSGGKTCLRFTKTPSASCNEVMCEESANERTKDEVPSSSFPKSGTATIRFGSGASSPLENNTSYSHTFASAIHLS